MNTKLAVRPQPVGEALLRDGKVDEAKRRILVAAENLFAEAPIASVSLREIASRSGHGNTNAVQYHFGSREGLVQAIFEWRVRELAPRRSDGLAKAEAEGKLRDLPTLMRILCLPYADLKNEQNKHTYAAFMSQYLLKYRPAGVSHPADQVSESVTHIRRLNQLIFDCIGSTSHSGSDYRIVLAVLLFCNTLVLADHEVAPREDPLVYKQYIETGLKMATSALEAGILV